MNGGPRPLTTLLVALLVGTGVLSLWSALESHARFRQVASSAALRAQLRGPALTTLDRAVEADALALRGTLLLDGVLILGGLAVAALAMGRRSATASHEASASALNAYEEAMGRMRDQRNLKDAEHEGQMRRFTETLADRESMARAGELTAGMAHEVRNSLNTIQGNARLLQSNSASGEVSESVGAILAECEHLQSSVRSFVDFIRQEKPEFLAVDLGRLLQRVAAREQRVRGGAVVNVHGVVRPDSLRADEGLLERAFENLIRNAREATGSGGAVAVLASEDDTHVTVEVADEGPGPSPLVADLERPFVTTKPGGLGLGLPTAMKIIQLHGGTLTLRNREDRQGAVARIRLPVGSDANVT